MRTERRKMMRPVLPSEYERLEYIENISNAYIDTGIDASHFNKIYCKMMRIAIVGEWDTIWGTRISATNNARSLIITESGKFWLNHYFYDAISDLDCNIGTMYETLYENGKYTINGKEAGNISGEPKNPYSCYIFVGDSVLTNPPGSLGNSYAKIRIYAFDMYTDEVILLSLIPCKRNSDGVIGMYDLVGRKFYTSPNGVPFTGGVKSARLVTLFEPAMAERMAA